MSSINVFKFGGASVKDAAAVRNVAAILKMYPGEKLIVVVSAMGKTTNALERLHQARFHKQATPEILIEIENYHREICEELFGNGHDSLLDPVFRDLRKSVGMPCSESYDFEYDQIVCHGELISTLIIQEFLVRQGLPSVRIDVREIIYTDNRYRDARVDWNKSASKIPAVRSLFDSSDLIVVQGFIGSDSQGHSTTLGREGSDFTAAIMAYLLDARSVTIWKDVPGMLNADPKWFEDTIKLDQISFHEAIELAYFGASVIHPKTIKPLQNKGIPLHIKSFVHPEESGTVIQEKTDHDGLVPNYIFKDGQVLISITPRDFSFMVEDNLKEIFDLLSELGIRINLMENSAISFSICVDDQPYKRDLLFARLSSRYILKYNAGLTLMTIRHYDERTVAMLTKNREILIEQRSRHTMRLVMR